MNKIAMGLVGFEASVRVLTYETSYYVEGIKRDNLCGTQL